MIGFGAKIGLCLPTNFVCIIPRASWYRHKKISSNFQFNFLHNSVMPLHISRLLIFNKVQNTTLVRPTKPQKPYIDAVIQALYEEQLAVYNSNGQHLDEHRFKTCPIVFNGLDFLMQTTENIILCVVFCTLKSGFCTF